MTRHDTGPCLRNDPVISGRIPKDVGLIDREEVLRIARLAMLNLSGDEIESFTEQLESILAYVRELDTLPDAGIDPTWMTSVEHAAFREDQASPSLSREAALQNAPVVIDGHFAVPRVIDTGKRDPEEPAR